MLTRYRISDGTVQLDDAAMAARPVREYGDLTIRLSRPVVVAESPGWCWYPDILKFSTGELMVVHSLNPDSNFSYITAQQVLVSTDGGRSWGQTVPPYDVNGFFNAGGEVRASLPDGSIIGIGTFPRPDPPGQWRSFAIHRWRFADGGRSYTVEPWGSTIRGLPKDVQPFTVKFGTPEGEYYGLKHAGDVIGSRWCWARFNVFSDAIETDPGRWLTTISVRFEGDELESTLAIVSDDAMRSWRYLSTVAGPADVPGASEGFDEPCLVRLADGDIMCVSRVGGLQPLFQTYSNDGGATWTVPEAMSAWSVAPQILRLSNGALILSTGRPGLYVWVSDDGRGRDWHPVEIAPGYHNQVMAAEHHIEFRSSDGSHEAHAFQTTSYTAMVEARPNTVYLVYDRPAFGWSGAPAGADPAERSRIYLLEIEVERRA